MIKTSTEKEIKRTEEWLDERYSIWEMTNRHEDLLYYKAILKTVEFLGYEWKRDENGKHTIRKA